MGIRRALLCSLVALAGACEGEDSGADAFADALVSFSPAPDTSFGQDQLPEVVLGPPGGTYDVVSLGCEGEIVVELDAPAITDGPGPDLIVFENPFDGFPEPGEVAVSDDGERWWVFPCDPPSLAGCAGVSPTLALPGSGIDPTDPELAGGDSFDLAALEDPPAVVSLVRIRDRSREYWEGLGQSYCDPGNQGAGGFDLDAVVAVH